MTFLIRLVAQFYLQFSLALSAWLHLDLLTVHKTIEGLPKECLDTFIKKKISRNASLILLTITPTCCPLLSTTHPRYLTRDNSANKAVHHVLIGLQLLNPYYNILTYPSVFCYPWLKIKIKIVYLPTFNSCFEFILLLFYSIQMADVKLTNVNIQLHIIN